MNKKEICDSIKKLAGQILNFKYSDELEDDSNIRWEFEKLSDGIDSLLTEIKDSYNQDYRKEIVDKVLDVLSKNNLDFVEEDTMNISSSYYIDFEDVENLNKAKALLEEIEFDDNIDWTYDIFKDESGVIVLEFEEI